MKKRILFIEDEVKFQTAFTDFFRSEELEIVSAYDGESGLALAESKSPDLILLDLILPRKDGFKVLEELKANPRLAKIPVIVLTNLESSKDVQRAISMGALAYLVKANYSLPEILNRIKETLKNYS